MFQPRNVVRHSASTRSAMAVVTANAILQNVTGMVEIVLCPWMTLGRTVPGKTAFSSSTIPDVIQSVRQQTVYMTTLTAGRERNVAASKEPKML